MYVCYSIGEVGCEYTCVCGVEDAWVAVTRISSVSEVATTSSTADTDVCMYICMNVCEYIYLTVWNHTPFLSVRVLGASLGLRLG